MKLLGSIVYITSAFYSFEGEFYLYIGLTPFLYLHHTTGSEVFQDGMFHKNQVQISDKMRMDKVDLRVIY